MRTAPVAQFPPSDASVVAYWDVSFVLRMELRFFDYLVIEAVLPFVPSILVV